MIDQNALIEIINNTAPIIATSPVVVKLVECVTDIVKTLYLPVLTFKKGKAEVDVELYKKQNSQFLDNQSFTLYEVTKLKNFLNSAKFASLELEDDVESDVNDKNVDFDWIMRFFNAVGNISNTNMQQFWGKILAGEVRKPGCCSLRTLDILWNMSQKEAETFDKLCRYVVHSGDCTFIFSNGFHEYDGTNTYSKACIQKEGLKYSSDIIPMIECGLISVDNNLCADFATENSLVINNDSIVCLVIDETQSNRLTIEPYYLTNSGIELYKIISSGTSFSENREYMISCCQELKQNNPDLFFTASDIINNPSEDLLK